MKHLKLFELYSPDNLSIIKSKQDCWEHTYIYYNILLNGEDIGKCECETIIKTDEFDDSKHDYIYNKNVERGERRLKKSDYDTNRFILYLNGMEIDEDHQNKGWGLKSMKLILKSINKDFHRHQGIYLSVFKKNKPAIKIYEKLGFKILKTNRSRSIHVMKLENLKDL